MTQKDEIEISSVRPGSGVVGVVGLGTMGAGIAQSLLRGGFEVVVADVRPQVVAKLVAEGAKGAADLADLATRVDAVLVVVVNDKQVLDVGAAIAAVPPAQRRVRLLVVNSTIGPATTQELGAACAEVGIRVVDAPVSGGPEKSALGTLTLMVGADDADADACADIFDAIGANVFRVGPVGAGSAAKLVNNVLALGQYVLQVEAMQLADAYGISEDVAVEFISVSAGDSLGIRTWNRYDRLRRTHTLAGTPAMSDMLAKDLRVAAIAGGLRGVSMPITATLGELIGPKLEARDRMLEHRGGLRAEVICPVCGQEVAAPFVAVGMHPQCRLQTELNQLREEQSGAGTPER